MISARIVDHIMIAPGLGDGDRPYLAHKFPEDKKAISKLTYDQKLEWYQHRFEVAAREGRIPVEFTTHEFARFWKWRVLMPMRIKRLYFRIKNLEIFKKYDHITEMKAKLKKHGI